MDRPRFFSTNTARVICFAWVALLAASFFFTLRYTRHEALETEEYAYACDPFGYLRMAKQIRSAFADRTWPQFKLESPQTRTLINFLQSQQIPASRWEEVVAPHAHHYFPKANSIGVQYPPGTGLALALFPQGEAVYGLNRMDVWMFGLFGVCALVVAFWKRMWTSIALVILTLTLGLLVIARMGEASLSINAVLLPILFTCLLTVVAMSLDHNGRSRVALLCAFVAGVSLGFATLVRLPSVLLLPGLVVFLWPGWRRVIGLTSLPLALVLGTVLAGVLPVLINQSDVAGAWYLTTYASIDAAPPTFANMRSNISFFLGNGPGAVDNWALLVAVAGFVGFVILTRDAGTKERLGFGWQRLALAAGTLWVISICYFLTHRVTAPHYMIPTVFATIALLAIAAFVLELTSERRFDSRRALSWMGLILVLVPGVAVLDRAWAMRRKPSEPTIARTHAPIVLPAELADDKAWIWADWMSGSFWYYANKPAFNFKIASTDAETRALIFRYIFDRGEPQYLVQDSEESKQYIAEIEHLGGKLELRGKVNGQLYFLIDWPSSGPLQPNVARSAQ